MNPTQAEVDAVVRGMLTTIPPAPRRRMRTYPHGCTCEKLPVDGRRQPFRADCPIAGHRALHDRGWK